MPFFFFFFFYQSLHLSLQHSSPERLPTYLEEQSVLCLSTWPSVWLLVTWFPAWWWSPRQNCQNHSPCEARSCEVLISADIFVVSPFFIVTKRRRENSVFVKRLFNLGGFSLLCWQFDQTPNCLNSGKVFFINSSGVLMESSEYSRTSSFVSLRLFCLTRW